MQSALVRRAQDHAVRADTANLRGLQVRDENDLPADKLVCRIELGDARNDLALLRAEAHGKAHKLRRIGHALRLPNLSDAQIDAVEIVDRDDAVRRRSSVRLFRFPLLFLRPLGLYGRAFLPLHRRLFLRLNLDAREKLLGASHMRSR